MSTIYEVAQRAGVSTATVSRVFNGLNVSPEKVRLVRKAAAELGFVPNRAARSLRTRTSDVIALVIADIENPFFTSLARGVEDAALAAGFSVVLCNTDEDADKEKNYLRVALSQNVAGVIITPATDHTDVSALLEEHRPVVSVDRMLPRSDVDAVMVDNRAGARAATEALVKRGFRRIGCIVGPSTTETAEERARGWLDVMHASGLDDQGAAEDYLVHRVAKQSGGREAMTELLSLSEPPTAVFLGHNLMAIGALEVLRETGRTPFDFGVSIFGDLPFLGLAPLGIELISLPARQIGQTAAKVLLERISGDGQPPRTIVVRTRHD